MDPNSVKTHVGEILKLPNTLFQHWDVLDVYPQDNPRLALAHYNENFDPLNRSHAPLAKLRGVIVDLSTGATVADSYGYNQSLPCYEPLSEETSPDAPQGLISVSTEDFVYPNKYEMAPEEAPRVRYGNRIFDKSTTKLFIGYEGAIARVFKWNGKVFFSTHKRIDATRSAWSGRKPFYELYQEVGGPDIESLFGDEEYSPYCYLFYIVHNQLRLASSTRDNRLLFLGVNKVWDESVYATENGDYFYPGDFDMNIPRFGKEGSAFAAELNRAFIQQSSVSVDIANKFLFPSLYAVPIPETPETKTYDAKQYELVIDYSDDGKKVNEVYYSGPFGDTDEPRLAGGDFIIMYTQNEKGETIVYRLESAAYEYRVKVTGDNPNLYNQFVTEMAIVYKATPRDLKEKYPAYIGADGNEMRLDEPDGRQVYWWSLFVDAVAPAFKGEVEEYYQTYMKSIKSVTEFILKDYPQIMGPQGDPEEVKKINENTQKRFNNLRELAISSTRGSNRTPFAILQNLLRKETGPSFYKMISTVRNIYRYREKKKEEKEQ